MSRGFLDEDEARGEVRDTDDARTVEIAGRVIRSTGRSLLFDPGDGRTRSIPLSQIAGSTQDKPDVVTLRLPEWLARKEGMI